MKITQLLIAFIITNFMIGCYGQNKPIENTGMKEDIEFNVQKTDEEWKKELSPEQYRIMRQAGTEAPGTGKYNLHFEDGIYECAGCGQELFTSDSKFDAHCGWPSFDKEIEKGKIVENIDRSHGMTRVEILCGNCGSHLGHVFNDGPTETGLRYCVNSASIEFSAEDVANAITKDSDKD